MTSVHTIDPTERILKHDQACVFNISTHRSHHRSDRADTETRRDAAPTQGRRAVHTIDPTERILKLRDGRRRYVVHVRSHHRSDRADTETKPTPVRLPWGPCSHHRSDRADTETYCQLLYHAS